MTLFEEEKEQKKQRQIRDEVSQSGLKQRCRHHKYHLLERGGFDLKLFS